MTAQEGILHWVEDREAKVTQHHSGNRDHQAERLYADNSSESKTQQGERDKSSLKPMNDGDKTPKSKTNATND